MRGAPTKQSPELVTAICELLAKGNTRTTASDLAGISRVTFWRWMADEDDASFRNAVEKAESEAQDALLATIRHASLTGTVTTRPDGTVTEAPGAWQAAAWMLERRWSQDYSRRETSRVEMTGTNGGPVEVTATSTMTDRERTMVRDMLRSVAAAKADGDAGDG